MTFTPIQPAPVVISAMDGFPLRGHTWIHQATGNGSLAPIVIINPATSVLSRYYSRFADFLHTRGFNVLTYDYRGIGGSRPQALRNFQASWLDWGAKDFEGVLQYADRHFPGHQISVVGHSVGGFLVGMAPSNHRICRIFTMGAQFAYWRDYVRHKRLIMYLRWHVLMPALTALFGYFPGQRLGWLEDTPRGVVRDWVSPQARMEDIYRSGPQALSAQGRQQLVESFARVTAPTLAMSTSDDEFATVDAVQRLLRYFTRSARTHLHIEPGAIGEASIGHFAFFNARHADNLWRIPLAWLRDGAVSDEITCRHITHSH